MMTLVKSGARGGIGVGTKAAIVAAVEIGAIGVLMDTIGAALINGVVAGVGAFVGGTGGGALAALARVGTLAEERTVARVGALVGVVIGIVSVRSKRHVVGGNFCYYLGNYECAREAYDTAITWETNKASYYNNLGLAYYKLGDYKRAEDRFNEAIKLEPKTAFYYNNLGAAYHKLNYCMGDRLFFLPEILDSQGVLYHNNLRRNSQAAGGFFLAVALDSRNALYHNNLGISCLKKAKDYDCAIRELKSAVELDSLEPSYHKNLGDVCNTLGDHECAKREYSEAARLWPKKASYYDSLSFACIELYDYARGKRGSGEAVRLMLENEDVDKLKDVCNKLGDQECLGLESCVEAGMVLS